MQHSNSRAGRLSRTLVAGAASLAMVGTLAACGGGSADSASGESGASTAPSDLSGSLNILVSSASA